MFCFSHYITQILYLNHEKYRPQYITMSTAAILSFYPPHSRCVRLCEYFSEERDRGLSKRSLMSPLLVPSGGKWSHRTMSHLTLASKVETICGYPLCLYLKKFYTWFS